MEINNINFVHLIDNLFFYILKNGVLNAETYKYMVITHTAIIESI